VRHARRGNWNFEGEINKTAVRECSARAVEEAHRGLLYEISTYKELDAWLADIMKTWRFI
jgi:hypothetical protein